MMPKRTVIFESPWCRLLAETLADGEPYYMLDVPDYVCVVARTRDADVVLVQQYRPIVGRHTYELPSGHVDPGETADAAARRELLEETGMLAGDLDLLGVIVPDVGRLLNRMWCYFAPDVVPDVRKPVLEEGVVPVKFSEGEVLRMATDGRIEHALNLSALFLAVAKHKLSMA